MLKSGGEEVEQAAARSAWFVEAWIAARSAAGEPEAALGEALAAAAAFLAWLVATGRARAGGLAEVSLWDAAAVDAAGLEAFAEAASVQAAEVVRGLLGWLEAGLETTGVADLREVGEVARRVIRRCERPLLIVTAARPAEDGFPQLSDLQVVAGPWVTGRATVRTPEGIWDLEGLLAKLPPAFREATLVIQADPGLQHRPRNIGAVRGRRLLVAEATDGCVPSLAGLMRVIMGEPIDGLVAASAHPGLALLGRLPGAPPCLTLPGLLRRFSAARLPAPLRADLAVVSRAGVLVTPADASPMGREAARRFADRLEAALRGLGVGGGRLVTMSADPRDELSLQAGRHLAVVRLGAETAPDAALRQLLPSGALPFVEAPRLSGATAGAPLTHVAFGSHDELARKLAEVLKYPTKAAPLACRIFETSERLGSLPATRRQLWAFVAGLPARPAWQLDAASRARVEHVDALRAHGMTGSSVTLLHPADLAVRVDDLAPLRSVVRVAVAATGSVPPSDGTSRVAVLPMAALHGPLPAWCNGGDIASLLVVPPPDALGVTDASFRTLVAAGFDQTADHDFVFSGRGYPTTTADLEAAPLDPPSLARPLPPPRPGMRTLKLYIDSATLPVIHQMADFVRCEFDPDVFKLVTWRRFPMTADAAAASQTIYFHQLANVSRDFVGLACALVSEIRPDRLEFHTNHIWALGGLAPVVRALIRRRLVDPGQIDLRIYGDGTWEIRDREAMGLSGQLGVELEAAALRLSDLLFGPHERPSDPLMNYGWHRLFRTTYEGLCWDRFFARVGPQLRDGGRLEAATRTMRFDHAQALPPELWTRYLAKMGITEELAARLRPLAVDPETFMFVTLSSWDPALNRYFRDVLITTIRRLRADGWIPARSPIAFKGHPANPEYDQDLMDVLAEEGAPVTHIPARVPIEVLDMAGLLPRNVGGTSSSSYHTIAPDRVRFICGPETDPEAVRAFPDNRVLVALGVVTPAQVLPWYP
jgi:hypothetical protein